MTTKEFKFDIGDKVTVIQSGAPGNVDGLSLSKGMSVNRIHVQYVADSQIVAQWFDEDELVAVSV